MANKEAKQVFQSDSLHFNKGNTDYRGYPFWFRKSLTTTGDTAPSSYPVFYWATNGVYGRRQAPRYHVGYQSFFFNSFKSIKTVPWLLINRPESVGRRKNRDYIYPSISFESYKAISSGLAANFFPFQPDIILTKRKNSTYRYQFVFFKPQLVPDTSFESDDWTDVSEQSTDWTRVN